jgi:hypothetical protein
MCKFIVEKLYVGDKLEQVVVDVKFVISIASKLS